MTIKEFIIQDALGSLSDELKKKLAGKEYFTKDIDYVINR